MTISVKIENRETAKDDATKELLIELLREDGTPYQRQTLAGGESTTVAVHTHSGVRITERFRDRSRQ
jgi:hypothetical protein